MSRAVDESTRESNDKITSSLSRRDPFFHETPIKQFGGGVCAPWAHYVGYFMPQNRVKNSLIASNLYQFSYWLRGYACPSIRK